MDMCWIWWESTQSKESLLGLEILGFALPGLAEAIGHLGGGLRPPLIKRPPNNNNNILYNIPSKNCIVWKKNCLNLECFLTHETYSDIDGLDLFSELKVLKEILQINENSSINVLNYKKRLESFPDTCIAFKILLTIYIIVASAERSFSKLKLIKSYLRSTMLQERLSGLVILSIEKEMLVELECKNLISNFASQKARKINFNWKKYMNL